MNTLLQLNTSLHFQAGHSTRLANAFVDAWRETHPRGEVITRDLAADPVPHLTAERFGAFVTAPEARSAEQRALVEASDRLIDELQRADVIVLALPMYNFSVPSTLKSYFDHIARAGVTFQYTAEGPEGLVTGKKAYVIATRGGHYPGGSHDTETAYVKQFLAFIGITDVEIIHAEGLALDEGMREAALAQAREQIADTAAAQWPLAA